MSIGLRDADCFQASMLAISDRLIALFMATSARPRKYSSENVFQGPACPAPCGEAALVHGSRPEGAQRARKGRTIDVNAETLGIPFSLHAPFLRDAGAGTARVAQPNSRREWATCRD